MDSNAAVKIYKDNQGSIALAKNPEFHKRTKHIDIRYHFVREKVEDNQVVLEYCPTQDMLAEVMTKPTPATQFALLELNSSYKDQELSSRAEVLSRPSSRKRLD